VAVIGHRVREKLFKGEVDPIGQYILIENVPFQVIGVLAEKAPAPVTRTAMTVSPSPTPPPACGCSAAITPNTW
jgi:hypothetical protein